jgi:hypothetical protein
MSGTSMAAPHVAGAALLYLMQYPGATPVQVKTALIEKAQQFVIDAPDQTTNRSVWVGLLESGSFNLQAKHSDLCLDSQESDEFTGAPIRHSECVDKTSQLWTFEEAGDWLYRVRSDRQDLCLEATGDSDSLGANVLLGDCHSEASQEWSLIGSAPGIFQLQAVQNRLCLEVAGGSPSTHASLVQWTCHTGDYQQWLLIEREPLSKPGAGKPENIVLEMASARDYD